MGCGAHAAHNSTVDQLGVQRYLRVVSPMQLEPWSVSIGLRCWVLSKPSRTVLLKVLLLLLPSRRPHLRITHVCYSIFTLCCHPHDRTSIPRPSTRKSRPWNRSFLRRGQGRLLPCES